MALRNDEWSSLWRASAYEAVPYTDDFPECLLVLPELIDGGVAQGRAPKILIRISLNNPATGKNTLLVEDAGAGIANEGRVLRWASSKNGEGDTAIHHRYGHGSKKCLTKWCAKYDQAVWMLQYRKQDRRGVSGCLHVISGPFRGRDDTTQKEDENDTTTLMPSGTRWTMDFDANILGTYQNPEKLYAALKEILRTRYSAEYFQRTEFVVEVHENGVERYVGNSKSEGWTSFQEVLEEAVRAGVAVLRYDVVQPFNTGAMTFRYYQITVDGRQPNPLKNAFPILGQKNMRCSRIHIALNGRCIEARHIYKFFNREANHNDYNGLYGVVGESPLGPFVPLNGTGLVAANPADAPFQSYSWWVTSNLTVHSFADLIGVSGAGDVVDDPEWRRGHFAGGPAPVFRLHLDGDHASVRAEAE
jgi:hypothetical protein